MSEAGALVDIVGLQDSSGELLQEIVLLIGTLGGRENSQPVVGGLIPNLCQALGGEGERLIPGNGAEAT